MTWYVIAVVVGFLALASWKEALDYRFRLFDDDTFVALVFTVAAGACFIGGYFLKQQKI